MTLLQVYLRALSLVAVFRFRLAMVLVANLVLSAMVVAEPILFGRVVDAISEGSQLAPTISGWLSIAISSALVALLAAREADRLSHRRRTLLMEQAYERIMSMPLAWHYRHGSSQAVNTLLRASEALFAIWLEFFRAHLSTAISLVLLLPVAMAMDIRLSAILFALGGIYVAINAVVVRKTRAGQSALEGAYQTVFSHVSDTLVNVSVIHAYNRIQDEARDLRRHGNDLLAAQLPVLDWWAISGTLNRIASTLSMTIVLVTSLYLLKDGEIRIGEILAFIGFANLLIGRLDQMRAFVVQIFEARAKLEAFFQMEDAAREKTRRMGLHPAVRTRGKIEFSNVSFRYDNSDTGVSDVSFVVRAGETVAIVGPTGSGKTTLINLLQGIFDPQRGRILIDDADSADFDRDYLHRQIAVVFQDGGILNRTVGGNIGLANPGATAGDISNAARIASADDFILSRREGYDAVAGERGNRLSGGERQRLAIARAILKDAPILVMDEATSALDVETETVVKKAVEEARRGRTTLIIAHRLSTVRDADLVIVLEKGRIVESGSYEQLSGRNGRFAALLRESGLLIDQRSGQPDADMHEHVEPAC